MKLNFIKEELQKAIKERYKIDIYTKALEKKVSEITVNYLYRKYIGTEIKRNGYKYKLYTVRCSNNSYPHDTEIDTIDISMFYTIISKLTPEQEQKLAIIKARLDKIDTWHVREDATRKFLHIREEYKCNINDILNKTLELNIEP